MRLWQGPEGGSLFSPTGWGGAHFGFPVTRHVQIDFAIEFAGAVIGPKKSDNGYGRTYIYLSDGTFVPLGPNQSIDDRLSHDFVLLLPLGLRVSVPFSQNLVIGVGGGASFLLHSAGGNQKTEFQGRLLEVCRACGDRAGVGVYALGRIEYLFGQRRRVGIGLVTRFTRARLRSATTCCVSSDRELTIIGYKSERAFRYACEKSRPKSSCGSVDFAEVRLSEPACDAA